MLVGLAELNVGRNCAFRGTFLGVAWRTSIVPMSGLAVVQEVAESRREARRLNIFGAVVSKRGGADGVEREL